MRKRSLAVAAMISLAASAPAAADEVSILKKKRLTEGEAHGYSIAYRHTSEIGKVTEGNAKVFCQFGYRPVYLVKGLDRGDGRKMDMDVKAEDGGLAHDLAPGYMRWAIDVWRKTCR